MAQMLAQKSVLFAAIKDVLFLSNCLSRSLFHIKNVRGNPKIKKSKF